MRLSETGRPLSSPPNASLPRLMTWSSCFAMLWSGRKSNGSALFNGERRGNSYWRRWRHDTAIDDCSIAPREQKWGSPAFAIIKPAKGRLVESNENE